MRQQRRCGRIKSIAANGSPPPIRCCRGPRQASLGGGRVSDRCDGAAGGSKTSHMSQRMPWKQHRLRFPRPLPHARAEEGSKERVGRTTDPQVTHRASHGEGRPPRPCGPGSGPTGPRGQRRSRVPPSVETHRSIFCTGTRPGAHRRALLGSGACPSDGAGPRRKGTAGWRLGQKFRSRRGGRCRPRAPAPSARPARLARARPGRQRLPPPPPAPWPRGEVPAVACTLIDSKSHRSWPLA